MKTKILYIGIGPYIGGPVISLIDLIENLDIKKFEPYIFSLSNPHKDIVYRLSKLENVRVIEKNLWINNWLKSNKKERSNTLWHTLKTPGRWARTFYNSWIISKIIKENNIDIVHSNIELTLEGAIAAWLANKPHIWHLRAPIGKNGVVKHWLGDKFCCNVISMFSNHIIVNSISTKKTIEKHIDSRKITLIYNGVNLDSFNANNSKGNLRSILNISRGKKIIASVGYLSEIKGGREFINIALNVCNRLNDVVFVWIGASYEKKSDDFSKEIFEIIKQNKLESRILFTGERNDINMLLTDVDVFLQPMINGSWSRVVLEAMATQIPVVAIEETLTSEFIIHNENGLLINNVDAATEAIIQLLNDNDIALKLSQNARKTVVENYTNYITNSKISLIYNDLLQ